MPKIPTISRNKFSKEIVEYLRQMNDRVVNGRIYANMNFGVYANTGGFGSMKLPPAAGQQTYFEGRCGMTRLGQPGRYRFVFLVDTGGPKNIILRRYFSEDHYASFKEIVN